MNNLGSLSFWCNYVCAHMNTASTYGCEHMNNVLTFDCEHVNITSN